MKRHVLMVAAVLGCSLWGAPAAFAQEVGIAADEPAAVVQHDAAALSVAAQAPSVESAAVTAPSVAASVGDSSTSGESKDSAGAAQPGTGEVGEPSAQTPPSTGGGGAAGGTDPNGSGTPDSATLPGPSHEDGQLSAEPVDPANPADPTETPDVPDEGKMPPTPPVPPQPEHTGEADSAPSTGGDANAQPPAPQPSYEKIEDGAYTIETAWGKSLDIKGAGQGNGANVQVYDGNNSAAQRFTIRAAGQADTGEWYYTIENVNSHKVLDCTDGQTANGTNVQQYAGNGTQAQQWFLRTVTIDGREVVQIVSVKSGRALDVQGGNRNNGANVQIYNVNGTLAQAWVLNRIVAVIEDGAYTIETALPGGRVVDVLNGSPDDGAALQIYDGNGTPAQQYSIVFDPMTGFYTITNYASGRVVEVQYGSNDDSTPVQQYGANGTRAQLWNIVKNSDGTYSFLSAIEGKALDVKYGEKGNGSRLQQYMANGSLAQKFRLTKTTPTFWTGTVVIRNGGNTYLVADVKNGSTAEGGGIQLFEANGTFAQKYRLERGEDGLYTIRSINSGLYVVVDARGVVSQRSAGNAAFDYGWTVVPTANGHFAIVSHTGKLVLGPGGGAAAGVLLAGNAVQSLANSWNFLMVPLINNGLYSIATVNNLNLYLDVAGSSIQNGGNVQLWQGNNSNAQKFYISRIDGERYTIVNVWSALNVEVTDGRAYVGQNIQQYLHNGTKAQIWEIVWDGAGRFVFKSQLGSFALSVAPNVGNGSNVDLDRFNLAYRNQHFRITPTNWVDASEADRIKVLNVIGGGDMTVFKSMRNISDSSWRRLTNSIGEYHARGESVGFLMMDLKTGAGVSYNIDQVFYSASTIKGPYVAAVNKWYPWLLDSYRGDMYNAINVSSNEAYANLRSQIGNQPLYNLMDETDSWFDITSTYYTWYSTRQLAKLWVGVGEYLMSNQANADWCRAVFGSNYYITSRPELSWKGCPIYAKSGWIDSGYATVHNEGCIVMDGDHPYLMVVMSNQPPSDTSIMARLMSALDQAHSDLVS